MASDIDPRLLEQIEAAGPEDEVEAVIVVQSVAGDETHDERGPGGALLDRALEQVPEQPTRTKFLPRLGALVVKGSPRLIRALIQDPAVISALASGGESFGLPE